MFAARLRAYAPGGASLGLLPDPLSWQASIVHGDLGALSVTYSTLSAGGPLIERPLSTGLEVGVEVWDGTGWVEPRGCRFVRVDQGADTADDMQVYSVSFRSYGWLLTKAKLTAGAFTDGLRTFAAPKAGPLLATIMGENAAIGGVPVTVVGGGTNDAGGTAWATLADQKFEYATDYLDIVRALQEAGSLDWATQNRGLYLYRANSIALSPDLSATVQLRLGLDIGQAPADETIESLVSQIAVRAQGGGTVVVSEPTAPTPHGVWQGSLAVGQVDNSSAAAAMGEAELERTGRAQEQYTRDLILHDDAPVPLLDYWPGAYITAPTSGVGEKSRVQQVTLTFGTDGFGGNVVLQDRLLDPSIRRARTVRVIARGKVGSGGPPSPIAVDPEASRVPSTPTGFDTVAGITFAGPTPRGVVTATWLPVSTATDSGALVIAGYELQYRIDAGAWQTIVTPEVSATIKDLTPGVSLDSRVRAVGARTTLPSAWSVIDTVVVPGDVTPPPVPTGLSMTSARGVLQIVWAGTPAMPADFARLEIAVDATETPTTVVGAMVRGGEAPIQDTVGAVRYMRARTVDTTGNASEWSAVVGPVTVASVVSDDIDAAVTDAISQALTGPVDGARIEPWTVPGDRVLIGDVDSRIPWNPKAGLVPHEAANAAAVAPYEHPSLSWCYQITGGSGTDGTLASAMTLFNDVTPGATRFPVEPGRSYRLSLLLTVAGTFPVARQVRASMNWYDATGAFLGQVGTPAVQGGTGTNVITTSEVFTAPDGARYATPQVQKNFWSDGTLYVHKVGLTLAADGELVVDGSIKARHVGAQQIEADHLAVGALDFKIAQGMELTSGTVTGALVRTSASGGQARMAGLTGGGGIWANDAAGQSRASMQVSDTTSPGFYTWDSAGTVRMLLFTSGTTSTMSFRDSGGVEVLKISDATIQHRYVSGRLSLEESQGKLLVYADTDSFPDIFRTYYDAGTGTKQVYVGHESSPVSNMAVWGDNVQIRSTSGTGGLVNISSRGTSGVQIRSYDVSGSVIRGYADFSTTRMWLGQYGPGGGLGSRLNLVDGQAVLSSGDGTGSTFISAGGSTGVVQLQFPGTTISNNRAVEIADATAIVARFHSGGMDLRPGLSPFPTISGDPMVRRATDGRVGVSSSSIRWKQDVEDHSVDLAAMRALRPRSWRARDEVAEIPDTTNRYVGLVAEEVHDTGLIEAVLYEADGTPRNINDRALIIGLIAWAKEHDARLAALEGAPAPMGTRMSTTALAAATATGDVVAIPAAGPTPPPTPTPAPAEYRPVVPPDHDPEVAQVRRASTPPPQAPAAMLPETAPHTEETTDD